LVAFHDPGVHAHAVADLEAGDIALLLLFGNRVDDIHKRVLRWKKRGRISSATAPKCKGARAVCRVVIPASAAILRLAAPVAQLDRVTASEAVGCAFEPRRAQRFLNAFWSSKALELNFR